MDRRWWRLLIILAIVLPRLTSLWTPIIDVDEAIFANIANRLLEGGVPYVDMLDNKPMGIFYFYAAIFAIFGKGNMIAVHATAMLIVAATCYFIYKIALLLKRDGEIIGFVSAITYALFTSTYIPKMIASEIEIVMMLPLSIGIYFWLKGEEKRKTALFLLSGVFSGLGVIFKYQAGINLVVIALYWLVRIRENDEGFLRYTSRFSLFVLGFFVFPLAMIVHLYLAGGLEGFAMWTLLDSAAYIRSGAASLSALKQFFAKGFTCMLCSYIMWIFAFWGLIYIFKYRKPAAWYLIIIWFILSWVSVITGFRFYGHYFIQLMPSAALIAALVLVDKWAYFKRGSKVFIVLSFIIPALGCTVPRYFTDAIYKAVGEDNPNDYKPIAEYIKNNTTKDDYIYAWGFAPCIYYYSQRNNASRFPFSNKLVGHISDLKNDPDNPIDTTQYVYPEAWEMVWKDFGKHPPKFIVDTATPNFHGYAAYAIVRYKEFDDYLKKYYVYDVTINGAPIYKKKD